jgi:uncharacterized protein YdeI (YjbR/CyaY-like superfamily)
MPIKVDITQTLYASNREEWRRWLADHHQTEREVWLIFYKKDSGKTGVGYEEAVEEALCFGWIDSLMQRIDDQRRAQRFSPRKPKSNWSNSNIQRVRQLIREGKMTDAGLATLPQELLKETE